MLPIFLYAIIILLIILICKFCVFDNLDYYTKFKQNNSCENIQIYNFGLPNDVNGNKLFKLALIGGVHGNEPAGAIGLSKLISNGYFDKIVKSMPIYISIIPRANPCGLITNRRNQPDYTNPDINRNFNTDSGVGVIAQKIVKEFSDADLIIDIHEGWSWHKIDKNSVGSTAIPTQTPLSIAIADKIVTNINKTISDDNKQFTLLHREPCDINATLRCLMGKKNKNYILIEISGQNNIQSMDVRTNQLNIAVKTIIDYLTKMLR